VQVSDCVQEVEVKVVDGGQRCRSERWHWRRIF
jgi:hypothetical protein